MRINKQAVIDRFEAAPELAEETVEKVARAMWEDVGGYVSGVTWERAGAWNQAKYRRLAAAAIAVMPVRPDVTRTMLGIAENLDYYASKTTGGTHATGLADAATQIRAAIAAPQTGGGQ